MPYDLARITAARAAVRWNYTKGNLRPAPEAPPPIQPLEETTLAALRRSLAAQLGPTAAAVTPVPAGPPRKPSPTDFRGANRTYSFDLVAFAGIGNSAAQTTELLSLPGIVRRILISTDLTTENLGEILISTSLSVNPSEAEIRAGPQIYPDPNSGLPTGGVFAVAGGAPFDVPMDHVLSTIPFRVACYLENIDAGPHRAAIHVTVQDLDPEDVRIISVPVILRPQVLSRSLGTAPSPAPRPAMRGTTTPRGVKISVLQAGQPIYSRDIAWPSLDPELKKQYYNYALSGAFPPTMQPIY